MNIYWCGQHYFFSRMLSMELFADKKQLWQVPLGLLLLFTMVAILAGIVPFLIFLSASSSLAEDLSFSIFVIVSSLLTAICISFFFLLPAVYLLFYTSQKFFHKHTKIVAKIWLATILIPVAIIVFVLIWDLV